MGTMSRTERFRGSSGKAPSSRGIHAVARLDREGLPYALAEFSAWHGGVRPVEAAALIAQRVLLDLYGKKQVPDVVSVSHLCDLLGIELHGAKPSLSRSTLKRESIDYLKTSVSFDARLRFRDGKPIIEVRTSSVERARVSVAHEIGHYLILQRGKEVDWVALRSNSSKEEESLAEYIGRLLLVPPMMTARMLGNAVSSKKIMNLANVARVTLHSAVSRSVDPDQTDKSLKGCILWTIPSTIAEDLEQSAHLFAPRWHVCPDFFIPVKKCHILHELLLHRLVDGEDDRYGVAEEEVSIGSMKGWFTVDAFAWGSLAKRTRTALSAFLVP